jgi:glucose/arabinose dehydrogenase
MLYALSDRKFKIVFFLLALVLCPDIVTSMAFGDQIQVSDSDISSDKVDTTVASDTSIQNSTNNYQYLFGCTQYVPFYHCDPIVNTFDSYAVQSKFSKVASLTRDPNFIPGVRDNAVLMDAHALESIRINNTLEYQSDQFTLLISIKPGVDETSNRYSNIVTYRNGIFASDWHNSGWELNFQPNDDPSLRRLRFTVYAADGSSTSPSDALIKIENFTDIAASFDGKLVNFYINGLLHSQANFTGKYLPDPGQNIKVAGDAYCSCYLTTAAFDDFKLYSRSLSESEILLRNSELDLVGYWKFDGDLSDSTKQGNDAYLNTMLGHMAFSSDGRLFSTEKNSGNIRIIQDEKFVLEPFATIPDIHINWEQGLLGLALDSKFTNNHFLYVYHNYKDQSTGNIYARVVRLTDVNNHGQNMTILLDRIPASVMGYHTGGALSFNPVDDMLYITVGDSNNQGAAQNMESLNGKVLRITRDGLIPPDNPFGSAVYNYGHRNMYGIGFDPQGHGLISEASENLYDEINYLVKGGNYGWPDSQPADKAPELSENSIKPLRSYFQTLNPTQIVYYDSDRFPELKDSFLVGAFRGYIYSYKIDETGQKLISELKIDTNQYPSSEVVGIAVSPSGEIYFGFYDIYKIESISFANKVRTMFTVEANASAIQITSLSFDPKLARLTAELEDESGTSKLDLRVMNSIIGSIGSELTHESQNTIADDGKSEVYLPYKVTATPQDDFSSITFEFFDDYSAEDNLKIMVSVADLSVTKTVPEFSLPFIIMATLLAVILYLSRIDRLKRSYNSWK